MQFSLARLFVITFWVAICAAAWSIDVFRLGANNGYVMIVGGAFRTIPLFIAVGTALNHPWYGAVIGAFAYLIGLLWLFFNVTPM